MPTRSAGRSAGSATTFVSSYTGVLLSSHAEIHRLRDAAERLMPQDDTVLRPEPFLASVSKGWRPRVVAVYSAGDLVGIMYTKERVISGLPTAVVYADGSLGSILLANPLHRPQAFRMAVEVLLGSPTIRGVRLRLPRSTDD